ncbi:MAG: capsule biosynthesis protein [Shimia sp.]
MTTKPKAKKFRIKRGDGMGANTPAQPSDVAVADPPAAQKVVRRPVPLKMAEQPTRTRTPAAPDAKPAPPAPQPAPAAAEERPRAQRRRRAPAQQPTPAAAPVQPAEVASPAQAAGETSIEAIRREGLTGRQLRMARRVAQKHGIAATSDFEAVKLLREKGVDPFQRANALELVQPNDAPPPVKQDQVKLPQTVPNPGKQLPSTEMAPEPSPAEKRASQISQIQKDIAKRRRRKMALLFSRLAVFVGLPTLLMGYYFYVVASPMYSTESSFIIQQNEASAAAAGGLGGLFGGTQLATVQDSIAVQGYLTSREAMQRLNEDHAYKAVFSDENLDPITRLDADATDEAAYKTFKNNVKIGYDPTEGIIKMEVIAPSPEHSRDFALALIGYAEEQISNISLRLRNDQMAGANASFEEAERQRAEAAEKLVNLQTRLKLVDPAGTIASIQTRIGQFEVELEQRKLELQNLLSVRRPNQARVQGLEQDIANLERSIANQRGALTEASADTGSLAESQAELRIAEVDFQTRDLMLQQALQALEAARISAERQVRYIAMSVPPTAPDSASYPKAFESTILSFLIFAGIYLMISLTSSILREQVSS